MPTIELTVAGKLLQSWELTDSQLQDCSEVRRLYKLGLFTVDEAEELVRHSGFDSSPFLWLAYDDSP